MRLGEGELTSGKPQSHCSPGSTSLFPHRLPRARRLDVWSKRQLPIPARRALSSARRLQLLKFRPGRKLEWETGKKEVRLWPPAAPLSLHTQGHSLSGGLHDAGLGRGWAWTGAAVPRQVVVQAQAVAQLMSNGGGDSQDAGGMVLSVGRGYPSSSTRLTSALASSALWGLQAPPPSFSASTGVEPRPQWQGGSRLAPHLACLPGPQRTSGLSFGPQLHPTSCQEMGSGQEMVPEIEHRGAPCWRVHAGGPV